MKTDRWIRDTDMTMCLTASIMDHDKQHTLSMQGMHAKMKMHSKLGTMAIDSHTRTELWFNAMSARRPAPCEL